MAYNKINESGATGTNKPADRDLPPNSVHWVHRDMMLAPTSSSISWSDEQNYFYATWAETYGAYWWLYRYDDDPTIPIFGLRGDSASKVVPLPDSHIGYKSAKPHRWYDENAKEFRILTGYYYRPGDYDNNKSVPGYKFDITDANDVKVLDFMTTHYVPFQRPNSFRYGGLSLHEANWMLYDRKRMTFVKDRADLLSILTEEGETTFPNTRIKGMNVQDLSFRWGGGRHYTSGYDFYKKAEYSPPVITFTDDFASTFDQDGTVTIKVEETDPVYNSGIRDVNIIVKKDSVEVSNNTLPVTTSTSLILTTYTTPESISGQGDHEIIVTATDRAGNSATSHWTRTIPEPPMTCTNWNGTGVANVEGKNSDLISAFDSTVSITGINANHTSSATITKSPSSLTETEFVEVLQAFFFEYEDIIESDSLKYFILFYLPSTSAIQWIGAADQSSANDFVDIVRGFPVPVEEIITYGFCKTGATEGAGQDAFPSTAPDYLSSSCDKFPGNAGVSSVFLQGIDYNIISNVQSITVEDKQFLGSFEVAEVDSVDKYKLIQDFLYQNPIDSKFKYFALKKNSPTEYEVQAAVSIKHLWKDDFELAHPPHTYTVFGYCDTRPGITNGSNGEIPPEPPPEPPEEEIAFGDVGLGTKSNRGVKEIIEGYSLGTAVAVTPELVVNKDWNWASEQSIENAMCVNRENFYNYLGHYIAPTDALTKGPFENDLTRCVDGTVSSTPAPFEFGGFEPKETERMVLRAIGSSKGKGDKARYKAVNYPGSSSATQSNYDITPGSSKATLKGTGNPFTNMDMEDSPTGDRGISPVKYDLEDFLSEYGISDENQLIVPDNSNGITYNHDLRQEFSVFTEYVWGNFSNTFYDSTSTSGLDTDKKPDVWGDPQKEFQTGVELEITVRANNDRGRSDAGISFGSLNRRATNDTHAWGKVWIGDIDDQSKDDPIIPDNSKYPVLYEFYNPHFSTGRLDFGNGAKATKTFHVRINRKPHERALRIYVQGFFRGNRRGELSPASFIPSPEKIFDLEHAARQLVPGFLDLSQFGGDLISLPNFNKPIADWIGGVFANVDNVLNNMVNFIVSAANFTFNLITNSIFGFLFALMGESYVDTYHSEIEIEVKELKTYKSEFEDEQVEMHPATKYFGDTSDPLAYIYTQYHYPFVDANRFRVFGKKFHHDKPLLENEIKTGKSIKASRVIKENRYYIPNLFRLTYETNIGVFYELMLKQLSENPASKDDHNYNIKTVGHETVKDSDEKILEQEECIYDVMFPTDLSIMPGLLGGLGSNTTSSFNVNISGKDPSKIQDKKTNEIGVHEYKDALSDHGISAASIADVDRIIGSFADTKSAIAANGYDLNKWMAHNHTNFQGLDSGDPRNLCFKIAEFILWYLNPNGIAQQTRLSASTLHEYEKITKKDIDDHDPNVPTSPDSQPMIVNGEIYERQCD